MKTRSLRQLALSILVVCSLPFAPLGAHEGEHHAHTAVPQSATAEEAWQNAQASLKAIQTAAADKQAGQIHTEQEKLAAFLDQLQEKSSGADKVRLQGAIRNAIAASEKVHAAADANDFTRVASSLKTLEATMTMVEKQLGASK